MVLCCLLVLLLLAGFVVDDASLLLSYDGCCFGLWMLLLADMFGLVICYLV